MTNGTSRMIARLACDLAYLSAIHKSAHFCATLCLSKATIQAAGVDSGLCMMRLGRHLDKPANLRTVARVGWSDNGP